MNKIFIILLLLINFIYADIKILSFNVENLFDGKNDGSEYKDFIIGKSSWSEAKFSAKLNKLAKFLSNTGANIIGLQEIENYDVLKELAKKSGYKFYAFSKEKNSPVGVGLLSNIPIIDTTFYRPVGFKSRDILRCDFSTNNEDFSVFVVHMLAPRNPIKKKKANFNLLYNSLLGVKNAIVIGDFNANYKDKIFNPILDIRHLRDLWEFDESGYSHPLGKIDHALLANTFFQNSGLNYKIGSFKVLNNDDLSDHRPIEFMLTNKKEDFNSLDKKQSLNVVTINEIYGKTDIKNALIKDACVTFIDKFGFAIAQKGGDGVYLHSRYNVEVGDIVDVEVKKTSFYKGNFEISNSFVTKKSKTTNLLPYLKNNVSNLRSGDVVYKISGNLKDKKMLIDNREFLIYNPYKKYENGFYEFKMAFFTKYKNQDEFIIKEKNETFN